MNLVEKICDVIKVKINEVWVGNDGESYFIEETGKLGRITGWNKEGEIVKFRWDDISRVIAGQLKPVWKPNLYETYYIPDIDEDDKVWEDSWLNDALDMKRLRKGIVFKTEEDAVIMANQILDFIEEERENE